jgi:hypothetical protein
VKEVEVVMVVAMVRLTVDFLPRLAPQWHISQKILNCVRIADVSLTKPKKDIGPRITVIFVIRFTAKLSRWILSLSDVDLRNTNPKKDKHVSETITHTMTNNSNMEDIRNMW